MSKREKALVARHQREEEKARKQGLAPPPPLDLSKGKVVKPRKSDVNGEVDKRVKQSVEGDVVDPALGGKGVDGFESTEVQQKAGKPPRTPSPPMNEADFTEEQLQRPSQNYVVLIYEAITNSKTGSLSLPQIYSAIEHKYPYYRFRVTTQGWQSSVRHNLGQHNAFRKVEKEGKGWQWGIVPGATVEKEKRKRPSPPPQPRHPYPYPPGHGQYPMINPQTGVPTYYPYPPGGQHPQQHPHSHPQINGTSGGPQAGNDYFSPYGRAHPGPPNRHGHQTSTPHGYPHAQRGPYPTPPSANHPAGRTYAGSPPNNPTPAQNNPQPQTTHNRSFTQHHAPFPHPAAPPARPPAGTVPSTAIHSAIKRFKDVFVGASSNKARSEQVFDSALRRMRHPEQYDYPPEKVEKSIIDALEGVLEGLRKKELEKMQAAAKASAPTPQADVGAELTSHSASNCVPNAPVQAGSQPSQPVFANRGSLPAVSSKEMLKVLDKNTPTPTPVTAPSIPSSDQTMQPPQPQGQQSTVPTASSANPHITSSAKELHDVSVSSLLRSIPEAPQGRGVQTIGALSPIAGKRALEETSDGGERTWKRERLDARLGEERSES